MSRKCELTGKKTTSGQNRPFSLHATKRVFRPNLFKKRVLNPLTGKVERMKLSAKAIRTLKKWKREGEAKAEAVLAANPVAAAPKKEAAPKAKKLTPKQKKEAVVAETEAKTKAAEPKTKTK